MARFVTVAPDEGGAGADLMAAGGAEARGKSSAFLNEYAGVFGLRDARELVFGREESDANGGRHIRYYQYYRGVPVFAAGLRTHFDASRAADGRQRHGDPGSRCRRHADVRGDRRLRGRQSRP